MLSPCGGDERNWLDFDGEVKAPCPHYHLVIEHFPSFFLLSGFSTPQCICILIIPAVRSILVMNAKHIHHFKFSLDTLRRGPPALVLEIQTANRKTVQYEGDSSRLFKPLVRKQASGRMHCRGAFNQYPLFNRSVVVPLTHKTCIHSRHTT